MTGSIGTTGTWWPALREKRMVPDITPTSEASGVKTGPPLDPFWINPPERVKNTPRSFDIIEIDAGEKAV
jgi:hypothetical protein